MRQCQVENRAPEAIAFTPSRIGTLGVEVELLLLDGQSLQPVPAAERVLQEAGLSQDRLKPEVFLSMLEVSTGICHSVLEVESDLRQVCRRVQALADSHDLAIFGAGTHPMATLHEQFLCPKPRYFEQTGSLRSVVESLVGEWRG